MKLIIWEIVSYLYVPTVWFLFKRLTGRNVAGAMLGGATIGAFIEFATEPLWDYHFVLTIYKDVPLSVILGWGVNLTLVTFVSEKLYLFFHRTEIIDPLNMKIYPYDLLAGILIALPLETVGLKSGVWDYNYHILGWGWGSIPLFNMPLESLVGYTLLMSFAPTVIRLWQQRFQTHPRLIPSS